MLTAVTTFTCAVRNPALRLSKECDPDLPPSPFHHISPVSAVAVLSAGLQMASVSLENYVDCNFVILQGRGAPRIFKWKWGRIDSQNLYNLFNLKKYFIKIMSQI
jgi:hypothetical protein